MIDGTVPGATVPSAPDGAASSLASDETCRTPHQCGAMCWRFDETGKLVTLLVTSKRTRRWIIPKGNLKKGEGHHECAMREAFEEAGVSGRIAEMPIGQYSYFKPERQRWLTVSVFPMLVHEETDEFAESDIRTRRWFSVEEAAARVDEPDLRGLLLALQ